MAFKKYYIFQILSRVMNHEAKLIWRDLSVRVRRKLLLCNDAGSIRGGTMTVLMGPSGAGKSTLMNALTARSTLNTRGRIFYKDKPLKNGSSWPTRIAYVPQEFHSYTRQTVYETLIFVCRMRNCDFREADLLIDILVMTDCRNTLVSKISGGEKKRLSIAVELIGSPKLIFMDEPTSGLDSTSARNLLIHLRRLATQGAAIFIAAHQPSTEIIKLFHNIYLMSSGTSVYQGTLEASLKYFEFLGYPYKGFANPCDFLLDLVSFKPLTEDSRISRERIRALQDAWKKHLASDDVSRFDCLKKHTSQESSGNGSINDDQMLTSKKGIQNISSTATKDYLVHHSDKNLVCDDQTLSKEHFASKDTLRTVEKRLDSCSPQLKSTKNDDTPFSRLTGFFNKFFWIFHRNLLETVRQSKFIYWGIFWKVVVLIILATVRFLNFPGMLLIAWFIILATFTIFHAYSGITTVLSCIPAERPIILRERKSEMYDGFTFYFAKLYALIVFQTPSNLIFWGLVLLIVGLYTDFLHFSVLLLVCALISIFMHSICLTICLFFSSSKASNSIGIIVMFLLRSCGRLRYASLYKSNKYFSYVVEILLPMEELNQTSMQLLQAFTRQAMSNLPGSFLDSLGVERPEKCSDGFNNSQNESGDFGEFTFKEGFSSILKALIWILCSAIIGSSYLHFSTRQRMVIRRPKK